MERFPDKSRPDTEVLKLLEICLKCNEFMFDDKHYLQVQGTAMGHRYAPSYANLYMSEWERESLDKCPLKLTFYYRFLDDIIGGWEHGESAFLQFVVTLNKHHPSITVKHLLNKQSVDFLDTTIFFSDPDPSMSQKTILTRVYFKPTNTHAFLHKGSYHPKHTFKGIVKSQIICFHRISSHPSDLHNSISIGSILTSTATKASESTE